MRLIDADALIAQMEADAEQMEEPIAAMFTYAAINDVKHAPTIEPERKKGHWVSVRDYCDHLNEEAKRNGSTKRYLPSGLNIGVYCDQCWGSNPKKSDYCPNCGADMRGGDEG